MSIRATTAAPGPVTGTTCNRQRRHTLYGWTSPTSAANTTTLLS